MNEYKISDDITIVYTSADVEYIDEIIVYFNAHYFEILKFFNIYKLDKPVVIRLWNNSDDFRNELSKITGYEYPFWTTGSSKNDKEDKYSRVDYLSLSEIKKIDYHKDETVNELKKGILHEFVHICHSQFCNYDYPDETYLTEGVATYLANQYENSDFTEPLNKIISDEEFVEYNNYRCLFNILVEIYSYDEILDILSNKKKIDTDKIKNINIRKM